jgi:hypothetical protein
MSGTWAMISPVAGFSTGIVFPDGEPFCEVVSGCVAVAMRRVYASVSVGEADVPALTAAG